MRACADPHKVTRVTGPLRIAYHGNPTGIKGFCTRTDGERFSMARNLSRRVHALTQNGGVHFARRNIKALLTATISGLAHHSEHAARSFPAGQRAYAETEC